MRRTMFDRQECLSYCVLVLAAAAAWASSSSAQVVDLDKPKEPAAEKPETWTKATEADVKKAEEAARKDACVALVEVVYRLPVAANRDVYDMLLKNPQVDKDLVKALSEVKPLQGVYLEDGTVRLTVVTTPAAVMDILKKAYAKVDWDKAEEDSTLAAVASRTKKDQLLSAVGESALAGSIGEKRLPVRRAALAKALEDIASKALAWVLRDDYRTQDHVDDFCLAIREAPKKLALGLSAAKIYTEEWAADGSLELRAEVNAKVISDLLINAQNLYDGRGKYREWAWTSLRTAAEDMILQGAGKAKAGESAPEATPLGPEMKAVDAAMKATQKK